MNVSVPEGERSSKLTGDSYLGRFFALKYNLF